MYVEILDHENLPELKLAFDMACNELLLGTSAKDIMLRTLGKTDAGTRAGR